MGNGVVNRGIVVMKSILVAFAIVFAIVTGITATVVVMQPQVATAESL
jgi:hypothetical protein